MNKVYISGTIADAPNLIMVDGLTPHLVFNLSVVHKCKSGLKRELYRVNAWNNAAIWGNANLKRGQQVMVHGYLTQRPVRGEGGNAFEVDVTAEEFFPGCRSTLE